MTNANNQTKLKSVFLLAIIIVLGVFLIYFKFIFEKPVNSIPGLNIPNVDLKAEQQKADKATMEKTASLVKAKDPAQCSLVDRIVNGVNYKTVCLNNIYYNLSADNLDYGACRKLVDMSVEDCQRRVMLMSFSKEKSISVCDKAPEKLKPSCPDAYWNFSAVDQKNPALCAKTSTPAANLSCQNNVLVNLASRKEISIQCSLFSVKTVKEDCGNYLKGKDACLLIKNALLKSMCPASK